MLDALIVVNFLIAAASLILTLFNARRDRRNRFSRMLFCLSTAYFAAFYLHMIVVGTPPSTIYIRIGITLILTAIATKEIHDAYSR